MKINTNIYLEVSSKYAQIDLPANMEEIKDGLDKIGANSEVNAQCRFIGFNNNSSYIFKFENCNIFELNHLGNLLANFDYVEELSFQGVAKIFRNDDDYNLSKLINLALNIRENEIVECFPVTNTYELGEFYAENDMIEELKNMSEDERMWVINNLDYIVIGENIHEDSNGLFLCNAYVRIEEDLEELYNGSFDMPKELDYVFKLGLAKVPTTDEPNDNNLIELKLPSNAEEYIPKICETGAKTLTDCVCYDFKSIIPNLNDIVQSMEEIETLNTLALHLQELKSQDNLSIYKAMIESLKTVNLETAIQICEYVEEFELYPNITENEEYSILKLEREVSQELFECVDLHEYGKIMIEKSGGNITEYGLLIPKDKISLEERLEEDLSVKEIDSSDFEMNM